jgi:hypothetical protein
MSGIDLSTVTRALLGEGLEVDANEQDGVWALMFEVNARMQPAILSAPSSPPDESVYTHYLLAISFISSDRLNVPLDQLSASTLRILVKVQSEVLLAKLDYWTVDGQASYVAVSPCSIVTFDGPKLRRRLEACADLASRVRAALMEPEAGGEA